MMFTRKDVSLRLVRSFSLNSHFNALRLLSKDCFRGARLSKREDAGGRILRTFPSAFRLFAFPFGVIFRRLATRSHDYAVVTRAFRLRDNTSNFVIRFIPNRFRLYFTFSSRVRFLFVRYVTFFRPIRFMNHLWNLLLRISAFLFRLSLFLLVESRLLFPFVLLILSNTSGIKVIRYRSHISLIRRDSFLYGSPIRTTNFTNISLSNRSKLRSTFSICVFRGFITYHFSSSRIFYVNARLPTAKDNSPSVSRGGGGYSSPNSVPTMTMVGKFLYCKLIRMCSLWFVVCRLSVIRYRLFGEDS